MWLYIFISENRIQNLKPQKCQFAQSTYYTKYFYAYKLGAKCPRAPLKSTLEIDFANFVFTGA